MSRTSAIRIVFAALAVGFFAAPIAARVLGVTAESFENRRLADAPKLSQGWEGFQQTSRYLVDRMPLRAQAVRANTRIWRNVFDEDPPYARDTALARDQALPFAGAIEHEGNVPTAKPGAGGLRATPATTTSGRDGWLYSPAEFSSACDRTISNELVLERWIQLVGAVRADGHRTAMFVVPQKASVYPEHLPDEYADDDCALDAKERFWSVLSRGGPALDVHELRSELMRLKAYAGDGLFLPKDSHWSTLGALALVRATLEEVGGEVRLKPHEIVDRGTVAYKGNLAIADGLDKTGTTHEYAIHREPDAPRVPGRTVIVCDSFAYRWMRLFKPYFEDVREVSWYKPDERILAEIDKADTVIFEGTEIMAKFEARDGESVKHLIRKLRAG